MIRKLVTRFYDTLWNNWDDAAVPEVLSRDFRFRGSLGTETSGLAAWRTYRDSIRSAAPDFHNELVDLVVDGDRGAARLRYSGHHHGTLAGIPATGRRFAYTGAAFFTSSDGQLTSAWVLGDLDGLRRQLTATAMTPDRSATWVRAGGVGDGDREDLRLAIYRRFATTGQAPTVADLAGALATEPVQIRAGLHELAAVRHVVLGADDRIVMAHPFSAQPLGFSVMSGHTLWWGGCAWDSFALPHLLADHLPSARTVVVATSCPACGRAHAWTVTPDTPPEGDQVAHFLVPAVHMWDDVTLTCANQRLFCSRGCVRAWLARTGREPGYIMDLTTLWRLAAHWYDGRLDRGYLRRDPTQAADYLRSVGLSGPFWGL